MVRAGILITSVGRRVQMNLTVKDKTKCRFVLSHSLLRVLMIVLYRMKREINSI